MLRTMFRIPIYRDPDEKADAPRRGPRAAGNRPKTEPKPDPKPADNVAKGEPAKEAAPAQAAPATPPGDAQPAPVAANDAKPEAKAEAKTEPKAEAKPAPQEPPALPPIEGSFSGSDVSLECMKILIFGDSGSGKTHFSANCDNVAILSLEPQGRASIRAANAKAMILPCKNMADFRRYLMMMVAAGELNEFRKRGIKTIVLDSITELQQFMIDEIQEEKRKELEAKNPSGSDGKPATKGKVPEMTQQDWGTLATKMRNCLRLLRDLMFNVVVLALCEPTVEQNTGVRRLYPKLSGSMQHALPAYFNIVGFLYKIQAAQGKVDRVVMLDGPENYLTKSYAPLNGLVVADLRTWFAAIAGEGDAAAKGARMPGQGVRAPSAAGRPPAKTEAEKEEQAQADLGI